MDSKLANSKSPKSPQDIKKVNNLRKNLFNLEGPIEKPETNFVRNDKT